MHWTHEQIMEMAEAAVFTRWLAGGGPQTIAEIASEIGVSESTLRRHSDQHAGAPRGCKVEHVERASGRILDALLNRSDRAFSLDEYVDAVFTVEYPCDDACGVYRRRTLDEAMRVVGAHA